MKPDDTVIRKHKFDRYSVKLYLEPEIATKVWELVKGKDITSLEDGIHEAIRIALTLKDPGWGPVYLDNNKGNK